ncbi:hypothetical protein D3C71_2094590 [compost metagenome]
MGIGQAVFDGPASKDCEDAPLFRSPQAPPDRFRPPLYRRNANAYLKTHYTNIYKIVTGVLAR